MLPGSILPLLLLPLLPLQEGGEPPKDSAGEETQAEATSDQAAGDDQDTSSADEATESEAEATPEPEPLGPVPTQYSPAWLGAVHWSWHPLDDPDAHLLPDPLSRLKGKLEAIFESANEPSLLMVRSLPEAEMQIDAFMLDEEVLGLQGEFIPMEDRELDGPMGHALSFDCTWTYKDLDARVAAMYFTGPQDVTYAIWIVTTGDRVFGDLQVDLEATIARFLHPEGNAPLTRYAAHLNAHELSFNLGTGAGQVMRPLAEIDAEHSGTTQRIKKVNKSFHVSFPRQWRDEKSGLELSFQVVQHDLGFGTPSPFINWCAGVYQTGIRGDIDLGDAPREQIHLANAHTEVISDEGLKKHYENCQRTRDSGVILEVLLPRSPFARAIRLNWERPQVGDPNFFGRMWFIELRHYHPGGGETVTGTSLVILRAHAKSRAELDALEASLDFRSRPLPKEARFPLNH